MSVEKCVVCNIKFENNIPSLNFGSHEKVSFIYRKILRIFCSYFNLPQKDMEKDNGKQDYAEITDENGPLFSFPFCSECRNLVAELCIFHEKVETMQKLVQKTVAKITVKILNTENKQKNSSKSNSTSQNENKNQIQEEKENGNELNYRQKIIQDFSPRVLLTKHQKQNPTPKQMQINETNGFNLTTNSGEENSTNSASSSAPEKRSQNLMEKIRSMAKTGRNFPPVKVFTESESFSTGFATIGNKYIHNSGKWWAEKTDLGWKCNSCSKTFVGATGPRIHMEMQHVTGQFQCKSCPRSFVRENLLKVHRCDFGVQRLKRPVEINPGKFTYEGKWKFVETEDGYFKCSTCSTTSKSKRYHRWKFLELSPEYSLRTF